MSKDYTFGLPGRLTVEQAMRQYEASYFAPVMGDLTDTGLIVGKDKQAIMLNPQSAYLLRCQCNYGCAPAFYVSGGTWVYEVDQATIYRTLEAAEEAITDARSNAQGCMAEKGVIFDAVPLAGYIK